MTPPGLRIELTDETPARVLSNLQPILFSMEQRVNAIPLATVVLSVAGNAVQSLGRDEEVPWCRPGSKVSIHFEEQRERSQEPVFTGVIVGQDLELKWNGAFLTLRLRHELARLEASCRSAVYTDMSFAAIVSQLLGAQHVGCDTSAIDAPAQEQSVQFQCSDWRYVRGLLDANNAWLLPRARGVDVARLRLAAQPDHTVTRSELGPDTFDASWAFSGQYRPASIAVTAWDVAQQQLSSVTSTLPALGDGALDPSRTRPLNAEPWVVHRGFALTTQDLGSLAESMAAHLGQAAVQGQFTLRGSSLYRLGQTLALSGFGESFDGRGIVTGIRHHIDKARWTTTVSLGLQGLQADLLPLPAIHGPQVGVVAEFSEDKTAFERIRVALPILGNQTLWARLAMPHASKDGGFHFYPDVGDEVVVGFFDGDAASPVVLGAMYNPRNKPPVPLSKENRRKGITLRRDKKELALEFDEGQTAVTLRSDKDSLTLKQGVAIDSQSDAADVQIKGKKIHLAAGKDSLAMNEGVVIDSQAGPAEVQIKGKTIKLINT